MAVHIARRSFLKGMGAAAAALSVPASPAGSAVASTPDAAGDSFTGTYVQGAGDAEYLQLLDTAFRMFQPDPQLQNISMLYTPDWNGFVEGPTWGAWWIQNSFGASYAALPFFTEPYASFVRNSQDLWFRWIADGKRADANGFVAPDGCLCDAASPSLVYYRQGDGRPAIHDWVFGFTTAGIILQAELLLVQRDREAIDHYLPLLERSAAFVDSRRDPSNNLFLVGPAANLLAPSYAGWARPDGTYDKAYLAELSVNYIAALDRLIELEMLAGRPDKARDYRLRRNLVRRGLPALTTGEGYFVKSIDPDGTKHGMFGAARHGYFEGVVNHDAIAFRVVDDDQARRIYDKLRSIPGMRPDGVIISNYPALDDMYESGGIWDYGTWINGGYWATCDARMVLAYLRLGQHADARASMQYTLNWARQFKLDAPMADFGRRPYQPNLLVNTVYDAWGVPAAMARGLFEYEYTATGLRLRPHIPPTVTEVRQSTPVRFGEKELYLAVDGTGPITGVVVNGKLRGDATESGDSVFLNGDELPDSGQVTIVRGQPPRRSPGPAPLPLLTVPPPDDPYWDVADYGQPALGNDLPLRIGGDQHGTSLFTGMMSRVRIYTVVLSGNQVAALAADPSALPPADGLLADYDLGSLSQGTVHNAVGEWMTATAVGTLGTPTSDGLPFVGAGYLEVPLQDKLMLGPRYTLEAWVRPDSMVGRFIDRIVYGGTSGYMLDVYNAPRLICGSGVLVSPDALAAGQWTHLAATVDEQGALVLYVGGRAVSTAQSTGLTYGSARPAVPFGDIGAFYLALKRAGLERTYEGAHAALVVKYVKAIHDRIDLDRSGGLYPLPPANQQAANALYTDSAKQHVKGLQRVIDGYAETSDKEKQTIWELWQQCCA